MADPHPFTDGAAVLVIFFVAAFVLAQISNGIERLVSNYRRRRLHSDAPRNLRRRRTSN